MIIGFFSYNKNTNLSSFVPGKNEGMFKNFFMNFLPVKTVIKNEIPLVVHKYSKKPVSNVQKIGKQSKGPKNVNFLNLIIIFDPGIPGEHYFIMFFTVELRVNIIALINGKIKYGSLNVKSLNHKNPPVITSG